MSRNGILIAGLALVVAVGALVLQFVLTPAGGEDGTRLADLESRVRDLQSRNTTAGLRVAFVDAESAFSVFLDAVSDLRQRAEDKGAEIVALQREFAASTISKEEFEQQYSELQVELLDAQLTIDIGTIEKMIASPAFLDVRSELQRWREEAQPIVDETKNLVSTAKVGVIDPTEFQSRYTQVKNAFTQFDQILTQVATTRIVQAAEKIALQYGFDLVLRKKNVVVYQNPAMLTDITDLVKSEISSYL